MKKHVDVKIIKLKKHTMYSVIAFGEFSSYTIINFYNNGNSSWLETFCARTCGDESCGDSFYSEEEIVHDSPEWDKTVKFVSDRILESVGRGIGRNIHENSFPDEMKSTSSTSLFDCYGYGDFKDFYEKYFSEEVMCILYGKGG